MRGMQKAERREEMTSIDYLNERKELIRWRAVELACADEVIKQQLDSGPYDILISKTELNGVGVGAPLFSTKRPVLALSAFVSIYIEAMRAGFPFLVVLIAAGDKALKLSVDESGDIQGWWSARYFERIEEVIQGTNAYKP